jgi:CheY-like chemotaxis protein
MTILAQILHRNCFNTNPMTMKKILIVEDDLHIQDIFRIIFNSYGYETIGVSSAEAIDSLQGLPDIIIMDKQLPRRSGVEACKRLKEKAETQKIPVILISASSGVQHAAELAGADDYLEKPFNMHVILKKVAELLKPQHG